MNLPQDFMDKMEALLAEKSGDYYRSLDCLPVRAVNVNTNKISPEKFVELCGGKVSPLGFSDRAYKISDDWKIGNSYLHHGGAVYVQEPGAMLPVLSVDIEEGINALDLCSAPGGKAVQLALAVGKSGTLVSNEIDKKRAVTLAGNVERMGFDNVIVTNCSATELKKYYKRYFDLVVVDAPCSGEGMFRKNPSAVSEWSASSVLGCAERQREILSDAVDMLKEGGTLVYSTCTFSPEENEQNVYYAVNSLGLELVAPSSRVVPYSVRGLDYEGLNGEYMRRVYPHEGVGEGQFFAVMVKAGDQKGKFKPNKSVGKRSEAFDKFARSSLTEKPDYALYGDSVITTRVAYPDGLRPVTRGVKLGDIVGNRFVPHHNLYTAYGHLLKNKLEITQADAERYLHGEELDCDTDGYVAVFCEGVPLGGGKASSGKLKNHYPKGLRT